MVAVIKLLVRQSSWLHLLSISSGHILENSINLDRTVKVGEELKASTVVAKKRRMSGPAFLKKNTPGGNGII